MLLTFWKKNEFKVKIGKLNALNAIEKTSKIKHVYQCASYDSSNLIWKWSENRSGSSSCFQWGSTSCGTRQTAFLLCGLQGWHEDALGHAVMAALETRLSPSLG